MKKLNEEIDKCRVRTGPLRSDSSYGMNGAFIVPGPRGIKLICIVSDQAGWEHVSVERNKGAQISKQVPYWDEMCFIKNFFWNSEETVVQYHPAESEYVRTHPSVLHLWRPTNEKLPKPAIILV